MSEPVDRFCDMIASFDDQDRQELLCHCRMALGPKTKSINAILNPTIDTIRIQAESDQRFPASYWRDIVARP